jgi:small subunit ribosomal protein S15
LLSATNTPARAKVNPDCSESAAAAEKLGVDCLRRVRHLPDRRGDFALLSFPGLHLPVATVSCVTFAVASGQDAGLRAALVADDTQPTRILEKVMNKDEKTALIREFAVNDKDVGSSEVQIAILSKRIAELTEHLKIHKKDHSTRRGLINMVNRRRKLLKYLESRSHERYIEIIHRLKLRR